MKNNLCKYAFCQIPLTTKQVKLMKGEKICNNCLKKRIKFQKENGIK